MRKSFLLFLAVLLTGLLPCTSRTQSLADLARQEKEKREKQKGTSKVYTNEDLQKFDHLSGAEEAKPSPGLAPTAVKSAVTSSSTGQAGTKSEQDGPSSERYWSKRFMEANARLQTAKSRQGALEAKLRDYNQRLLMQSDVYDREHLYQPLIGQTQDEIVKNKSEIVAAESDLETLRDELRKSGNPASWENSQLALQPEEGSSKPQAPKAKDQKYWQEQLSLIDKHYEDLIAPLNAERFQLIERRKFQKGDTSPGISSTAVGLPPEAVTIDNQIKELNQQRQQEKNKLIEDALRQGAMPGWFR
jgi:hypothetical protein